MQTNILLVDDRRENLLSMQAVLAPLGQNIVTATSGRDALKALLSDDFVVVILDVQMPGMDGFELARLMQGRKRSRQIPIIFVTALEDSEVYIRRGYDAGAFDFLFKPYSGDILRSKVSVFVELHRATMLLQEVRRREYQAALVQQAEENRRQQEAQHLEQILRELEFARNIQRSILPATFQLQGALVYADIRAARRIGGDFYDIIPATAPGMLTCLIGDVMGKSMPAAMTMVLALTVLRELSRVHQTPLELFDHANVRLHGQLKDADTANNVSAACFMLDVESREIKYCTAGHPDLLRWSARGGEIELLSTRGYILGMFEEARLEQKTTTLDPGDKLLMYTDGITEARNVEGDFFGEERLHALLERHGRGTVEALGQGIVNAVDAWQAGREPADDLALLILEVR